MQKTTVILQCTNFDKQFILMTDASNIAIGAVFAQCTIEHTHGHTSDAY